MNQTDETKEMLTIDNDKVTLHLNPKIYPLDVIYGASYIMIDKAFILLDGDPDKNIIIEIRKKKENQNLNELVIEFNDELINYATYKTKSEESLLFRNLLLRAMFSDNRKM